MRCRGRALTKRVIQDKAAVADHGSSFVDVLAKQPAIALRNRHRLERAVAIGRGAKVSRMSSFASRMASGRVRRRKRGLDGLAEAETPAVRKQKASLTYENALFSSLCV